MVSEVAVWDRTLTDEEIEIADMVARLRAHDNDHRGRADAHGYQGDNFEAHCVGCRSEYAFCKLHNFVFPWWAFIVVDDLKKIPGDVGHFLVRSTQYADGHLLLHRRDPDHGIFALVINESPLFRFPGYIRAGDVKTEEYWGDKYGTGRPCYWIPQEALIRWA